MASSLWIGRRSVVLGTMLLVGSTVTVVATANTPPQFTSLTVTPSIFNEGQTVVMKGTFTDPDVGDFHTLRIKWHDGSATQVVQLPAGQTTFQVNHMYRDNTLSLPNASVELHDRRDPPGSNDNTPGAGGSDFGSVPIQVKNVAPRFVESSIVGTASASGVVVEGDFADPSPVDTFEVKGAVGNPLYPPGQVPMSCSMTKGERHFRCEHTHQPNLGARTYTVNLAVRDDDGGQGTHTTTVRFPGVTRP